MFDNLKAPPTTQTQAHVHTAHIHTYKHTSSHLRVDISAFIQLKNHDATQQFYLFIYLFIYGCVVSLFLCEGFL